MKKRLNKVNKKQINKIGKQIYVEFKCKIKIENTINLQIHSLNGEWWKKMESH